MSNRVQDEWWLTHDALFRHESGQTSVRRNQGHHLRRLQELGICTGRIVSGYDSPPNCPISQKTASSAHHQTNASLGDMLNLPLTMCTVFAGKDPSRALATSSLKPEDCVPEWDDLDDKHKTVLDEWYTFFSKRYNVVGKVSPPQSQKL